MLDAVEFLRELRGAKAAFVPEHLMVEQPGPDGEPVVVTLSIDVDAFALVMWRKILRDKTKPGMLVRRHLEVCVFSTSRRSCGRATSRWPGRNRTRIWAAS